MTKQAESGFSNEKMFTVNAKINRRNRWLTCDLKDIPVVARATFPGSRTCTLRILLAHINSEDYLGSHDVR